MLNGNKGVDMPENLSLGKMKLKMKESQGLGEWGYKGIHILAYGCMIQD
jgi:hypothetical protein